MMKVILEAMQDRRPDVLLVQGTHFGSDNAHGITEFDLEEAVVGHMTSAAGLVLAAFSPMDVDRLVTFYRGSRRAGRTFVADAYAAFILHLVSGDAKVPPPTQDAG